MRHPLSGQHRRRRLIEQSSPPHPQDDIPWGRLMWTGFQSCQALRTGLESYPTPCFSPQRGFYWKLLLFLALDTRMHRFSAVVLLVGGVSVCFPQDADEGTIVKIAGLESRTPADWVRAKPSNR